MHRGLPAATERARYRRPSSPPLRGSMSRTFMSYTGTGAKRTQGSEVQSGGPPDIAATVAWAPVPCVHSAVQPSIRSVPRPGPRARSDMRVRTFSSALSRVIARRRHRAGLVAPARRLGHARTGHGRRAGQPPERARLPGRLAARLREHGPGVRRGRPGVAGDVRRARRAPWEYKAALNGGWDENYGLNAVRGGANIPLSLARAGGGEVLLQPPDALDHRQPQLGDRGGPGQLPERARLPRRLAARLPALLAPGPRRRRRLHVHRAPARRVATKRRSPSARAGTRTTARAASATGRTSRSPWTRAAARRSSPTTGPHTC